MDETAQKIINTANTIEILWKRVVIGILIAILLFFVIMDSVLLVQTIKAKDYIETTATYTERKSEKEDEVLDNYIYSFEDKQGNTQEITVGISKDSEPEQQIKIKYNEKNPQEYYEESALLDNSGIIWFVVKIVGLIILIVVFFNKKVLSKINISSGNN